MRRVNWKTAVSSIAVIALVTGVTIQGVFLYGLYHRLTAPTNGMMDELAALLSSDSPGGGAAQRPSAANPSDSSQDPVELLNRLLSSPLAGGNATANDEGLRDMLDAVLGNATGGQDLSAALNRAEPAAPKVDVSDEPDRYVIWMDLPGADQRTLSVKVDGSHVVVSAARNALLPQGQSNRMLMTERDQGPFHRTVTLPMPLDAGKLDFAYSDGILRITVAKLPSRKAA